MKKRCTWSLKTDHEKKYHDEEWGMPVQDERLLFEFLILEGAQAGLSWSTILTKREGYRRAFDNFEVTKVAGYTESKMEELLLDAGIVRNRLKIKAAVSNARAFIEVQKEHGSFSEFIWQFVNGQPIQNHWKHADEVPAKTEISDKMSKALKKRGFKFVGSTICYAFMQATGMVNDHTTDCFRHTQLK